MTETERLRQLIADEPQFHPQGSPAVLVERRARWLVLVQAQSVFALEEQITRQREPQQPEYDDCRRCLGAGWVVRCGIPSTETCDACHGQGRLRR